MITFSIVFLIIAVCLYFGYKLYNTHKHTFIGTVISVKQEDIDEGCKGNQDNCAIARAVKRAMEDSLQYETPVAEVTYGAITLYNCKKGGDVNWKTIWLKTLLQDKQISKFMDDFDKGRKVEPFWFFLHLPHPKHFNKHK